MNYDRIFEVLFIHYQKVHIHDIFYFLVIKFCVNSV